MIPIDLIRPSNVQIPIVDKQQASDKSPLAADQLRLLKGYPISIALGQQGSSDTLVLEPYQRVFDMTTERAVTTVTRHIALIEAIHSNQVYIRGEQVYCIYYKESGSVFVAQSDLEVLLDRRIEILEQ